MTDPFGPDAAGPFTVGRLPRITFGSGSFAGLPAVVAQHGRRALLVRGARWFAASPRREALLSGLEGQGVRLVGDVTVGGEPGVADVEDAVRRMKAKVSGIANVLASPAPDVEILQFTEFGPVLAVRPYTHTDSYWQVHFDTNRAIAAVAAEAGFPMVERTVKVLPTANGGGADSQVRSVSSA